MKMKDIVSGVSSIYRTKRSEIYELTEELKSIEKRLFDAKWNNYENISVAKHNRLLEQKQSLEQKLL